MGVVTVTSDNVHCFHQTKGVWFVVKSTTGARSKNTAWNRIEIRHWIRLGDIGYIKLGDLRLSGNHFFSTKRLNDENHLIVLGKNAQVDEGTRSASRDLPFFLSDGEGRYAEVVITRLEKDHFGVRWREVDGYDPNADDSIVPEWTVDA